MNQIMYFIPSLMYVLFNEITLIIITGLQTFYTPHCLACSPPSPAMSYHSITRPPSFLMGIVLLNFEFIVTIQVLHNAIRKL